MDTTATCGLSVPLPSATFCVVVVAGRWWLKPGAKSSRGAFAGALVSDFYAAYHHHYDGPRQRCWAHLLRDIHDLRALYPDDAPLGRWADAVHDVCEKAKAFTHPSERQRRRAQLALEQRLLTLRRPCRDDPSAAPARLCRRIEHHIKELFVFVAEPETPPDNNAAERSLRHLVVSRKVSGGTRSPR